MDWAGTIEGIVWKPTLEASLAPHSLFFLCVRFFCPPVYCPDTCKEGHRWKLLAGHERRWLGLQCGELAAAIRHLSYLEQILCPFSANS